MFRFIKRYYARLKELDAELAEIKRQQGRIQAAYDLHKEVLVNYGPEWLHRLTDPEEIIVDTKPITLINYFDI